MFNLNMFGLRKPFEYLTNSYHSDSSLDSGHRTPDMLYMSDLPSKTPASLYEAFVPEREALVKVISEDDLSSGQIVTTARKALDRTGSRFTVSTPDVKLQRAGLWLLEMVKSGASVLDQGTEAEIIWHEVPALPRVGNWGQNLFYAAALGLGVWAVASDSRIALLSVIALTLLRFLDPDNWRGRFDRFKFWKRKTHTAQYTDNAARAEARIHANAGGFVTALSEALKTADHILVRLSEPAGETHWRDDTRLMTFVQGLLEAEQASDGDFALKLVSKELESILAAEGIEKLDYSKKTAQFYDVLPAIGQSGTQVAAPALMVGDHVIARGTVWTSDEL